MRPEEIEALAAALHEVECLGPTWEQEATRHRRWDVEKTRTSAEFYAAAGYRIVPIKDAA
jgi:hypothetical protein